MKENSNIPDHVVKLEFDKSTEKFQEITAWVGILLNLFWFISDYFVFPQHLVSFLTFRIVVAVTASLALLLRKKIGMSIYYCMFILVLGISVQNAYMWTLMDLAHFQKHAFAYMVLFIGVGMLVLWEIQLSLMVAAITIAVNLILFYFNSPLSFEEFLINGTLITFTVGIFSIFVIRSRYRLIYNDIRIRLELEFSNKLIEQKHIEVLAQKVEIQDQKDALEHKNREITDSINYAKNIQRALLPSEQKFNSCFKDSFVLFKPKDIVSGDFYWVHETEGDIFYVTADCTGHGVPGGFMTMLALSFLEDVIVQQKYHSPEVILNRIRERIIAALNQSGQSTENKDGMDICICKLNKQNKLLSFASANNDLYMVREGALTIHKADRQPCGQHVIQKPFSLQQLQLQSGDAIYTFTDGYADQFGGPDGKKFRYKQFENVLLSMAGKPALIQREILDQTIELWKGTNHEQVDDICVIGVLV